MIVLHKFRMFQRTALSIRFLTTLRMGWIPLCAAFLLLACAVNNVHASDAPTRWIGSWATSQQLVEPNNALEPADLHDLTLRQIVHLSLGGNEIRLRFSNRFGGVPLHLTAVHVAKAISPSSEKIIPASDKALTFSGSPDVIIPPHADYLSDPVSFPANALSDVAITLHIDTAPAEQTGHPGSRATSYIAHGDLVSAPEFRGAKTVDHWYFIAGIDVVAPSEARAIVVLGDSITDGHGVTTNGNDRWTDVLAQRLQADPSTRQLAVLNQGIGGNHLLTDGLGPDALSRYDHDVIAQPGVRYLIVLEGINDVGLLSRTGEAARAEHEALFRRMIAAYEQIIARAHTHDIKVIGATMTPFVGSNYYHPAPANEADRQAVNEWIRTPGHFDALIDFDKITRDPQNPEHFLPACDSGDHLHPGPAGYAAMGRGIPLSLFAPSTGPAPRIAFTFDDLPAHGPLPPGGTRADVAARIISALHAAHVPPTYGFVNGGQLVQQPADADVLQAWRAAGNLLGNHTWSHMNLNQGSFENFEADVSRNEALLAKSMSHQEWRWFRFPFLAEGDTQAKKEGTRSFLAQHGYKIAAVTMGFGDYQWNEPFARCKAKGDAQAIASLEYSYLEAADESIHFYRGLSHTLYGRDIPYVLLMHIGAFDAEMMPRLLNLYQSRGFAFITLAEAESDEFYRNDTNAHLPSGVDTLEKAMAERHLPFQQPKLRLQLDALCR